MSVDIKLLVKNATTNVNLHKTVMDLQSKDLITDQEIDETWVEWGRKQFGRRLSCMAHVIITNANYGEPTDFKYIQESAAKGGSHNTMYSLLDHFSNFCYENGFPFYGVLVVKKDKTVPSGFLKWFRELQSNLRCEDYIYFTDDGLIKKLTKDCYELNPPSAHELSLALATYIYKHGL